MTAKESQKTANMPITSIEKKFPIIHSKIRARRRRTGPVKKNTPLKTRVSVVNAEKEARDQHDGIGRVGSAPAHLNHSECQGRDDEAIQVSLRNDRSRDMQLTP